MKKSCAVLKKKVPWNLRRTKQDPVAPIDATGVPNVDTERLGTTKLILPVSKVESESEKSPGKPPEAIAMAQSGLSPDTWAKLNVVMDEEVRISRINKALNRMLKRELAKAWSTLRAHVATPTHTPLSSPGLSPWQGAGSKRASIMLTHAVHDLSTLEQRVLGPCAQCLQIANMDRLAPDGKDVDWLGGRLLEGDSIRVALNIRLMHRFPPQGGPGAEVPEAVLEMTQEANQETTRKKSGKKKGKPKKGFLHLSLDETVNHPQHECTVYAETGVRYEEVVAMLIAQLRAMQAKRDDGKKGAIHHFVKTLELESCVVDHHKKQRPAVHGRHICIIHRHCDTGGVFRLSEGTEFGGVDCK